MQLIGVVIVHFLDDVARSDHPVSYGLVAADPCSGLVVLNPLVCVLDHRRPYLL